MLESTGAIMLVFENEISAFIDRVEQTYLLEQRENQERRAVERIAVTIPAVVIPMDSKMRQLDYRIYAITRDISGQGTGLVSTDPINYRHITLQFSPYRMEMVKFLCRVVYCRPSGRYFQIGCQYVTAPMKNSTP